MHELSIAQALAELVRQHRPAGVPVLQVQVQAGPMQAVQPDALELAWKAVTQGTDLAQCRVCVETPPWRLRCPECGRQWNSDELESTCACGQSTAYPVGGDELLLLSMEVGDLPAGQG